jgi:nucleoside-diphosphate-sugar epimerase
MTILISGATGFLGRAVLDRLAGRSAVLLLRGGDHERRAATLARRHGVAVTAVPGDVQVADWGLDDEAVSGLRETVTVVVHLAALTRWSSSWTDFERANIAGAEHAVGLAARLGVPLLHASSVFVGYGRARIPEALVEAGAGLTKYERSKNVAEHVVAETAERLGVPTTVARVAALVGDADPDSPDRRSAARVPLIRMLPELGRAVPYARGARIDVVPRDVTARRLVELADGLAAGVPAGPRVEVVNLALGPAAPHVSTVLGLLAERAGPAGDRAFAPVAVPAGWLRQLSRQADRYGRSERAALAIGLRYFAGAGLVEARRPLADAVDLAGLQRALGLRDAPVAAVADAFYGDWSPCS